MDYTWTTAQNHPYAIYSTSNASVMQRQCPGMYKSTISMKRWRMILLTAHTNVTK
jgi:hypothetical protein